MVASPVDLPGATSSRDDEYIAAIDGLRAISVLSVLVYHLDETMLPGGFTGVDVFFVISGFVVTRSLLHYPPLGIAAFIGRFYRRRILRIVPALLLFLLVTAFLAVLFVPEGGLSRRNDAVGLAAVFGLGNMMLWYFAGDYFSPVTTYNPFTHTWSLGVEEQFYFLFPMIFFLFAATSARLRHWGLVVLGGLSAASLTLCAIAGTAGQDFAFYGLLPRFWELGAGALLALWLAGRPELRLSGLHLSGRFAGPLLALGLAGLAVSFLRTDAAAFPFPGAILPVAASGLLCAVLARNPAALAARLLAAPPLVFLGRLSYSIYLWHFGIIVLLRWTIGLEDPLVRVGAATATILLALASYRLVEQPIRRSPRIRARSDGVIIAGGLAAILFVAGVMGGLFLARPVLSLSITRDAALWSVQVPAEAMIAGCRVERRQDFVTGGTRISFTPVDCPASASASGPQRIVALGDSHAGAYETLLQQLAGSEGIPTTIYQGYGCPLFRLWDSQDTIPVRCGTFETRSLAELDGMLEPGDVLLLPGLRMPRLRDQWDGPVIENADLDLVPVPADAEAGRRAWESLGSLTDRGLRIVVEAPTPLFRAAPFRCVDPLTAFNPYCRPGLVVSRDEIEARRSRSMAGAAAFVASGPGISLWDPLPVLCPEATCAAMTADGRPLFVDGDHLAPTGNHLLLPTFRQYAGLAD